MRISGLEFRRVLFRSPSKSAGLPCSSAWMLRTMVVTIDSIMKPVLGAPVGTGVASTGGIATHTPAAKIRGCFGLRLCLSTITKPRGLHSSSEEHTSELQSLMRISYAVFCLKQQHKSQNHQPEQQDTTTN